ncbi:MAG: ATP-grasp domain-containing protein [Candidatus Peribacteraceae bacterium]|nr:ATP-grasp domain-containing protein [Candidatus Peribacteraceae bacterium]
MGLEYLDSIPNLLCASQKRAKSSKNTGALFPVINSGEDISSIGELLNSVAVQKAIEESDYEGAILPYVNTREIEKACSTNNWKLFAPSTNIIGELERKDTAMHFIESVCPEALLPATIIRFGDYKWKQESAGYAVQRIDTIYSGGKGTLLAKTEDEFYNLGIESNENVKISPFVNGPSLNINAVAHPDGTITTDVSLQIIGPKICSENSAAYCGNDWDAAKELPEFIHKKVRALTEKVGAALSARDYKGWFGIDFLVDSVSNHIYIVEINPRLQGSTSMITITQSLNKQIPLLCMHIMAHLSIPLAMPSQQISEEYRNTTNGAHILLRNGPKSVKYSHVASPGLYMPKAKGIWEQRSDSIQLADTLGTNGIVIHGIPPEHEIIPPHDRILTIQSPHQVLQGVESSLLTKEIFNLSRHLRGMFHV